jgi:hypothetical protein
MEAFFILKYWHFLIAKIWHFKVADYNPLIQPAPGLLNPLPFLTPDVTVAIGIKCLRH